MTFSLGFINLLGWFRELRETFVFEFIIKDVTKDTDEDMFRIRNERRGVEIPCSLWVCHPPGTSMGSAMWNHSKPCPSGFVWRLHCTGTIDNRLGGKTYHGLSAAASFLASLCSILPLQDMGQAPSRMRRVLSIGRR